MDRNKMFFRGASIRAEISDDGSLPITFSTEKAVKRWFGDEILLHGSGNVDLSRLKKTGAVLLNHNPNFIVGPISTARIENREGKAKIKFDADSDGEKAKSKVESGSLKGVSVGYTVQKFREVLRDEEVDFEDYGKVRGPAMVAIRWTPYEVSLTPIPADPNSTVGRAMTRSLEGIEIEKTLNTGGMDMERAEIQAMIDEAVGKIAIPTAEDIASSVRQMMTDEQKPKIMVETDQFKDLIGRAAMVSPECRIQVTDMILDGKHETEVLRAIQDFEPKGDATDNGGRRETPGEGGEKQLVVPGAVKRSFSDITDEQFWEGICNPAPVPLNIQQ